jgi:hypothetical protein
MPIPKYNGEKDYISKCMAAIGDEYEQDQALAICYGQMNMKKVEKQVSAFDKQRINFRAMLALKHLSDKGINLAEEGGGDYPWSDCIADQIKQYGDEDTAKKVCGYIKSKYGS